ISIGDYVLAGGEAATLVMCEAIVRLLPGVLGNPQSAVDDSFSRPDALLEGPVFTRPPVWRGLSVPDVLLSGDHARVQAWRDEQARPRTRRFRAEDEPPSVGCAGCGTLERIRQPPATGGHAAEQGSIPDANHPPHTAFVLWRMRGVHDAHPGHH